MARFVCKFLSSMIDVIVSLIFSLDYEDKIEINYGCNTNVTHSGLTNISRYLNADQVTNILYSLPAECDNASFITIDFEQIVIQLVMN